MAIGCVDGFVKVYDVKRGNLTHNYKVNNFLNNAFLNYCLKIY